MAEHIPCDTIREVILVVTCCDRYQTERAAFIVDYISSQGEFLLIGGPAVFACVQCSQLFICSFAKHLPLRKPTPNDQLHTLCASASNCYTCVTTILKQVQWKNRKMLIFVETPSLLHS